MDCLISPSKCEEEEPKPAKAASVLYLGGEKNPSLQPGQKSQRSPSKGGPNWGMAGRSGMRGVLRLAWAWVSTGKNLGSGT
jgi:hypothetical protein